MTVIDEAWPLVELWLAPANHLRLSVDEFELPPCGGFNDPFLDSLENLGADEWIA